MRLGGGHQKNIYSLNIINEDRLLKTENYHTQLREYSDNFFTNTTKSQEFPHSTKADTQRVFPNQFQSEIQGQLQQKPFQHKSSKSFDLQAFNKMKGGIDQNQFQQQQQQQLVHSQGNSINYLIQQKEKQDQLQKQQQSQQQIQNQHSNFSNSSRFNKVSSRDTLSNIRNNFSNIAYFHDESIKQYQQQNNISKQGDQSQLSQSPIFQQKQQTSKRDNSSKKKIINSLSYNNLNNNNNNNVNLSNISNVNYSDVQEISVIQEKNQQLEEQLQSKTRILDQMKQFQNELLQNCQKAQEEYRKKLAEKNLQIDQLRSLIEQLEIRNSKLEEENTKLLCNNQNLDVKIKELALSSAQKEQKTPQQKLQQQPIFSQNSEKNYTKKSQTSIDFSQQLNQSSNSFNQNHLLNQINVLQEQKKQIFEQIEKANLENQTKNTRIQQLEGQIEKLKQNQNTIENTQLLKEQNKLILCLEDMIIQCAPTGYFNQQKPSLRQIWKWIKNIMNEYMQIKLKQSKHSEIINWLKNSIQVKEENEIYPKMNKILQDNLILTKIAEYIKNQQLNLSPETSWNEVEQIVSNNQRK